MTLNSLITIWEDMEPPCSMICKRCGDECEERRGRRVCDECNDGGDDE